MKMIWYRRPDYLWNARCACGATLCGFEFEARAAAERGHAENVIQERGAEAPWGACAPALPEMDPEIELVFP
jgi:hypothetical protein